MEKVSHRSIRSLAHKSVAVDENNNNGTYSQSNGVDISRLQAFFACDLDAVVTDAIIKGNELSNHISHAVITASVQKLLRRKFKYIECHLIGSRVNGTTVNDGAPLDVYLDFAGKNLLNDKSNKKFSCYMTYLQSLMNASSQWSNVERVEQTQFGILSATHNTTKMNCRFVFGSGEFVGNNDMIESFLTEQTMCRPLILCIRLCLEQLNAPHWTDKFSGYIVSLLVIFYLYVTGRSEQICSDRLGLLLMDFFKFYSFFDFKKEITSLFKAEAFGRNVRKLRGQSHRSSLAVFNGLIESEKRMWQKTNMRTQDAFLHNNNVEMAISAADIDEFQNYCTQSMKILRAGRDSFVF